MPFGLRSATLSCQRTNKSVVDILQSEHISIDVYIDDFYGAETPDVSDLSFQRVKELFGELGLVTSPDKESHPSTSMVCLGVLFNTTSMTTSVPAFRVVELQAELTSWLTLGLCSRRKLQCLLGNVSFVAACVPPGRVYFARLLNALRNIDSQSHQTPVTEDMLSDIHWWLIFLDNFNGVSVIPNQSIISDHHAFATDACLTGCGGILFDEYFHRVLVAIKSWATRLAGCSVTIYSDNSCCVALINFHRAHDEFLQHCLRDLVLHLALNNITLSACHVSGSQNCIPDYLSRWHLSADYENGFHQLTSNRSLTEINVEEDVFLFSVD